TDAAVEAADVALMGDELEKLPYLLRLGRRTRRVIGMNIALSVGVKFLFLLLAVAGWTTLSMAIAADVGIAVVVVVNGLSLMRGEGMSLPLGRV
ncbi:MAG: cation-transporting P-type ATPase, partial [Candidatus Binatia bacterium]